MCSKTAQKTIGIVTLLIVTALSIVGIVLASLSLNLVSHSWSSNEWSILSTISIVAVVYLALVALLGVIGFCCPSKCMLIFFLVIFMISILFTLAAGIFALVAGSVTLATDTLTLSCQSAKNGFLDTWTGVDEYLHQVDELLCSKECGCNFYNVPPYVLDKDAYKVFLTWTTSPLPRIGTGARSFKDCSYQTQLKAYENAKGKSTGFDQKNTFKDTVFFEAMALVEKKFNCVGWCKPFYVNSASNTIWLSKFLFSDVNRGIPKYKGCFASLSKWLPAFLQSYGIILVIVGVVQIVVWVLALIMLYGIESENEHKVLYSSI